MPNQNAWYTVAHKRNTHTHTLAHTHSHTLAHTHSHTQTHTHTNTNTNTHTNTHTLTHHAPVAVICSCARVEEAGRPMLAS